MLNFMEIIFSKSIMTAFSEIFRARTGCTAAIDVGFGVLVCACLAFM